METDEYDEDDGQMCYPIQVAGDLKSQQERLNKLQVPNQAGGYSYKVDDLTKLLRFLILGTDGGTYYSGEPELKRENAHCIDRLIITGKGQEVVNLIKDVSIKGRACKQKPVLFALALCSRSNDPDTKSAAYQIITDVCRIPTHLFEYVVYCESESAGTGWGRAHKKALSDWYHSFYEKKLALPRMVTKFRSRHGWSHKDVIRLAHIKPKNKEVNIVARYITKGLEKAIAEFLPPDAQSKPDPGLEEIAEFLKAVEVAKKCRNPKTIVSLITKHRLAREHIPTELLIFPEVWKALLRNMPMEAMIRNLGKMTAIKLLVPGSLEEDNVIKTLKNQELLQRAMIHPFKLLIAYNQYKAGRGERGKLTWQPTGNIIKALEDAFHLSFGNVQPTGKKFLLAVDVSGSMTVPVNGTPSITARDAAAAMMMVTARVEPAYDVVAFANDITPLDINKTDTIHTVIRKCSNLYFSGTDCSRPITYAIENKMKVDVFIVYTDSETYYGNIHPSEALVQYRRFSGIQNAKLIVVGMASNGFSIADPTDPFMLDVVGFDASAPQAMDEFVRGKII